MNDKNKNNVDLKKIIQTVFFGLLVLLMIIGSSFGIYKFSNLNSYSKESQYNISTTLEVDIVNNGVEGISAEDAANQLLDRMSWYGYSNGSVDIVDTNTLLVTFDLDYLNTETYTDDNDETSSPYSYDSLKQSQNQLLEAFASLFYVGNVEFRSSQEELLIDYDEEGGLDFIPPAPETEGQSYELAVSKDQNKSSSTKAFDPFDIDEWTQITDIYDLLGVSQEETTVPPLIESADVVYKNGASYIELFPYDYAFDIFDEAMEYMASNVDPSTNPYGNVYSIWIGYDVASALAMKLAPDLMAATNNSVTSFCFSDSNGNQTDQINSYCEPFLLNYGKVETPMNPNSDSLLVPDNLGKKHAESAVARINLATQNYSYKVNDITWNTSVTNSVFLKVMILVFLIFTILAFVMFTWYFGLLGALFGSSSFVVYFSLLAISYSALIPIGIAFSFIMFITLAISFYLNYLFLNKLKNNFLTGRSRMNHIKSILRISLFAAGWLLIFSIPSIIASLILFDFLSYNLLLLIAAIFVDFLLVSILGYIVIFAFTILNSNKTLKQPIKLENWDILFGRDEGTGSFNKKINFLNDWIEDKKITSLKAAKISSIIMLVIGIIGSVIFGFLIFGGHGLNSISHINDYYRYDVVQVIEYDTGEFDSQGNSIYKEYNYNTYDGFVNGLEDPINFVETKNNLDDDSKFVESQISQFTKVLDSNEIYKSSIYTNEIEAIPPEYDSNYDPTIQTVYQFGYTFKTKDSLSSDEINIINEALLNNQHELHMSTYLGSPSDYVYHYEIFPSSTSITNNSTITTINVSNNLFNMYLVLLLIFIVMFIFGVVLGRSSGSTSTVISVWIESLFALGFLGIFYIPLISAVMVIIPVLISISFILKIVPILEFNRKNKFSRDVQPNHIQIQAEIKEAYGKYDNLVYLSSFVLIIFAFVLLIFFNIMALSLFFVLVPFAIGMILNHKFVMPHHYAHLEKWRRQSQHNKFESDLEKSNNSEFLDEEYIKGINY